MIISHPASHSGFYYGCGCQDCLAAIRKAREILEQRESPRKRKEKRP
jgi:hypothetical protein